MVKTWQFADDYIDSHMSLSKKSHHTVAAAAQRGMATV